MGLLRGNISQQRYYLIKRILWASLIILGIVLLIAGINFKPLFSLLNNNSNFIIALLTLLLVIITAFYAWVTFRMLFEMRENRISEIRPMIHIELDSLEGDTDETTDEGELHLNFKFALSNLGRAAAINTTVEISIPVEDGSPDRPGNYVCSKPSKKIPVHIPAGFTDEYNINLYSEKFLLDKYKDDYLEMRLQFEDIDRNLYTSTLNYRLVRFSNYLDLLNEEIYIMPFAQRKYVSDRSSGYILTDKDPRGKLILRRRPLYKMN